MNGWNFLEAEADILQYLKNGVQSGPDAWARFVGTRVDLATATEDIQQCPALFLVYDGFIVTESNQYQANVAHRWVVVIAVSNASNTREATPRNQDAGPLLAHVLGLLHGYRPVGCTSALVPVTPPRPYYSEARFGYFPLAFTCNMVHTIRQGRLKDRPGRI